MVLVAWLVAFALAQAAPIGLSQKAGVSPNQQPQMIPGPCDSGDPAKARDPYRSIIDDIDRPLTEIRVSPESCILSSDESGGYFTAPVDGDLGSPDESQTRVAQHSVFTMAGLMLVAGVGMQCYRRTRHAHPVSRRRSGNRRSMAWI